MTSLLEIRRQATLTRKIEIAATPNLPILSEAVDAEVDFDIAARLERQLKTASQHELETVPRKTLLKMLIHKKLDEHFIFKTALGKGGDFVQAMRQVLTRTRKEAKRQGVELDEFKLYEISIISEEDHDVVTLERSKRLTKVEGSVYDDLISMVGTKKIEQIEHKKEA